MGDACEDGEKLHGGAREETGVQEQNERLERRLRFLRMADDEDLSPALHFIHQLLMLELAVKLVAYNDSSSSASSSDARASELARFRAVTQATLCAMAEREDLPPHMRTALEAARRAWLSDEHQCCVDALEELRSHCTSVLQDGGGLPAGWAMS